MSLSVIILAAGKGSRMKSSLPKVFHGIGNYPMLYHVLDTSEKLNPKFITMVISDSLEKYRESIKNKNSKVNFAEQKKQLGTAHAVMSAFSQKKILQSNETLILYADTPLISAQNIRNCLKNFKKNNFDLCILAMLAENTDNSYGRLIVSGKKLKKIVEKSELNKDQKNIKLCNSGIMMVKTDILFECLKVIKNSNKKKEFYLTDLVEILSKKESKVSYFNCKLGETMGVNDKKELSILEKKFQSDKRENFLKKGVTLVDPESVFFSKDTKIGKDVIIHPNVVFGPGVKIGNSVEIKSFSHLENTIIGENVSIGPFARLRDNTIIDKDTKVGNFVEIKKSKIAKNVKISHLSYLGDSTVKKNTNIGAGSITCNYDGIKKNKTIIEENCFIGSNTSLIAPLKINKNSVIGAGTVVDKNIKEGTVVYRKSQLIKKNKRK